MPDQILAVGPNGRKRMIPPRWLELDLGFRRYSSKRGRRRDKQPEPTPTETNTAAEPTAEPDTKE